MKLSEQIYKLRTAKGLSQEALAEALEVSRQSVSKWETGASVPELDKLVKMAGLFGVSLDELVTGSAPVSSPTAPALWEWNRVLALAFFILAGLCPAAALFFGNLLGIHTHQALALAGLFVLLGVAALHPRDSGVFRRCLDVYCCGCILLAPLSLLLTGLLGFLIAYGLVLAAWKWYLGRITTPQDP